jgi:NAD(P)H-hydrate epimerase
MKTVSTEQMRELDRRTIEEYGVPGERLMERAGAGVARRVRDLALLRIPPIHSIRCFAGHGNNGGDAFVAARYLAAWGMDVEVWLAAFTRDVRGDALGALERLRETNVAVHEMPEAEAWQAAGLSIVPRESILLDGLLGTGTHGAPREPIASAVRCLNASADEGAAVVAIDVPSGMDADTGEAAGDVVRADLTVTMAFPKNGLLQPRALPNVGTLEVVDIGIPAELGASFRGDRELICAADVHAMLPRRAWAAHKGTYGRVLIVGGAAGYAGAAAMAARAAVHAGAGLVSALVPETISDVVVGLVPEAMVHAGRSTKQGSLAAAALDDMQMDLESFDAVLAGPGLTQHSQSLDLVSGLLARVRSPLVLDADALNVCVQHVDRIRQAACPVVITPHPGEMGRLLGWSVDEVQSDRDAAARLAWEKTGATVILKGAGTIVRCEGSVSAVNTTGNPGMATGGTGDVLSGIVVALLSRTLRPCDAARAAVYLHGLAGDHAAWRLSETGLSATDVLAELPSAFAAVMAR